jgi:hypothetical protein
MQGCGYHDWLAEARRPVIEAETIAELTPLLSDKRPCTRLTLQRQPLNAFMGNNDSATINAFLRSVLSLPETWQGIEWRQLPTSIILWDEMMRAIQYSADRSHQYMNKKEAHVLVGKIVKALNDFERSAREFTNHRANGIWYPVTEARWQYWMVTMNTSDIGVIGIEEA